MSRDPALSVIIPTFNRAALVREAIDSVLAQTCHDFELIVVDDGSWDQTAAVVAAYGSKIRLIRHTQRRGVSAARNIGADRARGEWLAFLDSDDLWLPRKIETQLAYVRHHPEVRISQTEELWLRRGRWVNPGRRHQKRGGDVFTHSLDLCLISPSAVMLPRRLFLQAGGFDEALPACEDYDLWLRLTWREPVGLISEPLVIKRGGHADQLSGQWGLDRFRVYALVKLAQDPELPPRLRPAVLHTLAAKAAVYAQGCEKRGKAAEAQYYRQLAGRAGRAGESPGELDFNRWALNPDFQSAGDVDPVCKPCSSQLTISMP
ncbi:MAG: glycosyltransferase family 2 protein [Deltaproteobacteria bacterium]|nr:glycosyltransferase family 2 protein [Deltaproteobacteria bacterium]